MPRFALRRLAAAFVTLFGVLTLVFLLMEAAPGDPATAVARAATGHGVSAEAVAAFRRVYGLDRPLAARYVSWLAHAATLDFGRSFLDGRPVTERLKAALPTTLALNGLALLAAILVAVPSGIAAARRPGDRFARVSALVFDLLFATPAFVAGLLLLLVFSAKLRWTPLFADPAAGPASWALPVVTLALASIALIASVVRTCVGEALNDTSALAARARGEGSAAQVRRALRRSAVPFAALAASLVPALAAGSILVERLFSWPGAGRLLAEAVFARDLPVVLGLTFVTGLLVVVASFLSDLFAAWVDPRTRDERRPAGAAPEAR
jgi:ABC-type dipeptide/oligopeptide/nickel transport system permease component